MKPWEKYQAASETKRSPGDVGPWTKYEKEATVAEPGLLDTALATVDKYAGAPMRAGYGKFQDSLLKKGIPMDVAGAAKAAYDQFGKDPANAPTAEQLVEQNPIGRQLNRPEVKEAFASSPAALGVRGLMAPLTGWDRSGEIVGEVPKQAANLLVAGETDPLSYVPGAVFEKPIAKGLQLGGKALSGAGKFGAYLAENTTGIPRQVWSNYAGRAKEIGKLAKDYVGDNRYMQAYTDFRNQVGEAVAGRKNQLNEMIDQGLGGASRGSKISITPIIEELDTSMRGLHPVTEKAAIDEIQALKNKVREIAPEGKMSPWDAYKLQRFFHDRSMKAFAEGGQLFNPSSQAARAAKSARYKTTEMVNQFFPDTIKKANQQFVSLHNIDDMIPPSMLDPNGSAAALRRASLDPNSKERKALSQLSQFLHGDDRLVQQAMDLSTFEKMTNLPMNPLSGGGTTSTSRTLLGGGVGLLGEASEDPEAKWAARAAGAMIASPALLKMGLDAGLMLPNAAKKIGGKGGLLEKGVEKTSEKMSPIMKSLEKRLQGAGKAAKDFIDDEEGKFSPDDLFNILKPGEENVFDLKKARGLVGEPKRGLLEPKDNPVANIDDAKRYGWKGWKKGDEVFSPSGRSFKVLDSDGGHLKVEFIDPNTGKRDTTWLTPKEQHNLSNEHPLHGQGFTQAEMVEQVERNKPIGSNPLNKEKGSTVYRKSNPDGGDMFVTGYDEGTDNYRVWDGVSERWVKSNELVGEKPRGLLTSLDVERGPVTERPEAGKVSPLVMQNGRPPELKAGTVIDLPNGKQVITVGEYSHFEPGKGRVYWVEPSSAAGFKPGSSGKEFQITEKEMLGEKYADYFASKQAELDQGRRESVDFQRRYADDKKAEAERAKKGLIGVDFGGRGGKVPKEKAPTFPKDAKFQKNQEVTYDGRPAKVVQYDGNGVYTVKVGNSHQQVHMSELKGGKGKKELVDALMSGELKVPGISVKRGKQNPNQGLIDDLWANREKRKPKPVDVPLGGSVELNVSMTNDGGASRPKYRVIESVDDMDGGGYLVENISTGETHTVSDSEIARVFDENGKLVSNKAKPKGGKGKPKKKK